jgi:membrane fusion protein (multidrug efflux system)
VGSAPTANRQSKDKIMADSEVAERPATAASAFAGKTTNPATADNAEHGRSMLRSRLLRILAAVVAIGAAIWTSWYLLVGQHHVSTDDAYVGAHVATVTPQVAGAVVEVAVDDTRMVRKGELLLRIDPADARIAVAQAEADYDRTLRRVRGYLATNDAGSSEITARDADMARARAQLAAATSDVERTRIDLSRRRTLAPSGDVSGEELTTAANAYQAAVAARQAAEAALAQARANHDVARGRYQAELALTRGSDVESNPEVAGARAALDAARLNLERTAIHAPIDGMIARRRVQVGQRVAVGSELMTIVPLSDVYVDANLKEVQLARVKPGMPAEVTSDQYGSNVVYHGRVTGVGGGTGAAFATIPAQNATGNWIKVVQRLPVRIALDRKELAQHPLRVGLSMTVDIDLDGDRAGGTR